MIFVFVKMSSIIDDTLTFLLRPISCYFIHINCHFTCFIYFNFKLFVMLYVWSSYIQDELSKGHIQKTFQCRSGWELLKYYISIYSYIDICIFIYIMNVKEKMFYCFLFVCLFGWYAFTEKLLIENIYFLFWQFIKQNAGDTIYGHMLT